MWCKHDTMLQVWCGVSMLQCYGGVWCKLKYLYQYINVGVQVQQRQLDLLRDAGAPGMDTRGRLCYTRPAGSAAAPQVDASVGRPHQQPSDSLQSNAAVLAHRRRGHYRQACASPWVSSARTHCTLSLSLSCSLSLSPYLSCVPAVCCRAAITHSSTPCVARHASIASFACSHFQTDLFPGGKH